MIITRKYIMKFRTDRGAWTKPQIEALGIDWPPRKGWIDRVVGKELSERSQIEFESRIGATQARRLSKQRMNLVLNITPKDRLFDDKKEEALKKYEWKKAEFNLEKT